MKRLIAGNTGPAGTLSDSFHKALLTYRNGPDPDTKMSPAMCVFGRPTRDLLPGIPNSYRPHSDWSDKLDLRERALSKRTVTGRARWDEHTQGLSPLKCVDTVLIQNQTGRHRDCGRGAPVPSIQHSNRRIRPPHHQESPLPTTVLPPQDRGRPTDTTLPTAQCPPPSGCIA